MKGILGRKAGMTHFFTNDGKAIPVTIIEILPNTVMQVKTLEKDGYNSVKLGYGDKKENKANKALIGAAKKAHTTPKYFEAEIRDMEGYKQGDKVHASIFVSGDAIDVIGTSKGKGFAGSIKRHNQSRGPESHGSKFHRSPGSLGSISGQVFKTKKLPGRLGGISSTQLNLQVVYIDEKNNAIAVRGSIPGPNYSYVIVREAHNKLIKFPSVTIVDVQIEHTKNELLIEAKHYGAAVTSAMSINEMKTIIHDAKIKHEEELKIKEELVDEATKLGITNPAKLSLEDLKKSVDSAKATEAKRQAAKIEEQKAKEQEETKVEESSVATEEKNENKEEGK